MQVFPPLPPGQGLWVGLVTSLRGASGRGWEAEHVEPRDGGGSRGQVGVEPWGGVHAMGDVDVGSGAERLRQTQGRGERGQ